MKKPRKTKEKNSPAQKVAVLPVPDWACWITSRPLANGTIPFCWIAEGFSKPYYKKMGVFNFFNFRRGRGRGRGEKVSSVSVLLVRLCDNFEEDVSASISMLPLSRTAGEREERGGGGAPAATSLREGEEGLKVDKEFFLSQATRTCPRPMLPLPRAPSSAPCALRQEARAPTRDLARARATHRAEGKCRKRHRASRRGGGGGSRPRSRGAATLSPLASSFALASKKKKKQGKKRSNQ